MLPVWVFGQTYVPFPTQDNGQWRELGWQICEDPSVSDTFRLRLSAAGTTATWGGREYNHLIFQDTDIPNDPGVPQGLIREEDKRIYYVGTGTTYPLGSAAYQQEVLLYDFNVHAGDTVVHTADRSAYSVIGTIDALQIGGSLRKRYQIVAPAPISGWKASAAFRPDC